MIWAHLFNLERSQREWVISNNTKLETWISDEGTFPAVETVGKGGPRKGCGTQRLCVLEELDGRWRDHHSEQGVDLRFERLRLWLGLELYLAFGFKGTREGIKIVGAIVQCETEIPVQIPPHTTLTGSR